ncbi:MAG: anaerobic carbon-monoxide dehydrogenase catalytic subunit [Dehalococcoidia bacterium]
MVHAHDLMAPGDRELLDKAHAEGLVTGRDRLAAMQPQCGFGELGTCCRMCYMGPCRIDPFGEGPQEGVCGAGPDTIVARNLLRECVGGAASHMGHARHVALLLKQVGEGKVKGYEIKGKAKLLSLAQGLGIATKGRNIKAVAVDVADVALNDFGRQDGEPMAWLKLRAPKKEFEMWKDLGILFSNPHNELEEAMHRTSMGNDADPVNLLLALLRMGLADGYAGLYMGTDLQDVLFGVPKPVQVEANMGVLKVDSVNLAVHGHNPLLSEKVLEWAGKMEGEAKAAGAKGVNVVGVCCTGNELTMRHGVPMAGHNLQSELILVTGAVDEMVVDIQCIWPHAAELAGCYHTAMVTTDPMVKIPGATHIEFHHDNADEKAQEIVRTAIEAYKRRDKARVNIPKYKSTVIAGLSVEAIIDVLKKVDAKDPLKPVIDNIVNGNILGAVGFVGCPSLKLRDTAMTERMTKVLLQNNVLVVTTGCTAHILGQAGFMNTEAAGKYCSDGLKAVLTAVGEAAGLGGALPPVWHMGSCLDNCRIADLLAALAAKLDIKISQLPVAGSAPELVQEKAISIGTFFLALGLTVHLAPAPRILGSPVVTKVLTQDLPSITGGRAYVETDPEKAALGLIEDIKSKRKLLGLSV